MTTNRLKHTEPSSSVPTGGDTIKARALGSLSADQSALEDKTPETYSPVPVQLMELVVDDRNMLQAWKKVKANKGAPGPDGITLEAFIESFRHQWPTVRQELLDGTYQPSPARRKAIPRCCCFGAGWLVQKSRHSQCRRQTDPASHPPSPNADLRSGFLGIELRFPAKALCTRSHQTSPASYPLWIPTLCRHGLVQIFRPSRSFRITRKSIAEGKRSTFASIDQPLFACRGDGRFPMGTID